MEAEENHSTASSSLRVSPKLLPVASQELASMMNSDKTQLQELNDRFASYVDAIRKMGDPSMINSSMSSAEHVGSVQFSEHFLSVKTVYEKELDVYRGLYEEMCEAKTRELAELGGLKSQISELTKENLALKDNICELDNLVEKYESKMSMQGLEIAKCSRENDMLKDREIALNCLVDELKEEVEGHRESLEKERISRVSLQNKLVSVEEKLSFKESLHKEEMSGAFSKISELQSIMVSSSEQVDNEDDELLTYDDLAHMRMELQDELVHCRTNIVSGFKAKLSEMEDELSRKDELVARLEGDVGRLQDKGESVMTQLESERTKVSSLEFKLKAMEKEHSSQLRALQQVCDSRESRLNEVTGKLHDLMYDYEEVVGVRVSLDTELEAYRRLLDSEEKRLKVNLTPKKRTAEDRESLSSSFVHICGNKVRFESCDLEFGHFVRLANMSKKQVTLSGCKIQRKNVTDNTCEVFKLPQKVVVPTHEALTLFSSSAKVEVASKSTVVLQELSSWVSVGDCIILTLLDGKDQVMAEASITYTKLPSVENTPVSKRRRMSSRGRESLRRFRSLSSSH